MGTGRIVAINGRCSAGTVGLFEHLPLVIVVKMGRVRAPSIRVSFFFLRVSAPLREAFSPFSENVLASQVALARILFVRTDTLTRRPRHACPASYLQSRGD